MSLNSTDKTKESSETLKHQKPTEENRFNGRVSEVSDEINSCLDPVVEKVNGPEKESESVKSGITVNNREKCKTVYQVSILRNTIRNEERRKEKTLELTALTSNIKTYPEELDVIVISSTEEENCDFDKSDTFNRIFGKNDMNTDKFHEEVDNEVEILKAKCSDIEEKLTTAKEISDEAKYKCSLKVKKELTTCMQSLEKLIVNLRNKRLQNKPKILKEQVKPSCSYHQKHPEKLTETPVDKYRYRSQAFTRLTKISHHYEFNSQMPPWKTVKTSHKCNKRSEHFSGSEGENCKNLHKKKCMSQYSYDFQQSPEKKIKRCSKNCCSSKNCTSYRKARETEFHSYSNEPDWFGGRGGFSKSFIAHRELMFSNPRNYADYLSHSNTAIKMSNPTDKYKSSVLKPCSRKKTSERPYEKGFNLHKYGREYDFNNDLSDSSEISSVSDREFSPIHSPIHYSAHGKNKHAKSVKKNEIFSKGKPRKGIKEKHYETDEISMFSSDSDISIEAMETSRKRHKEKAYSKYDVENERIHNLVGRQRDFINKHVSKKDGRIEPTQASFSESNIDEKYKQNYFDKEKNKEEISSSEGTTPILENTRKRKKKSFELPFKQTKISGHSDLRNILNNKHQSESSEVKFHSRISSRSRSTSPVETNIRSPCKPAKTKFRSDSPNTFKNKYNTENSKVKLQSYIVSPSSGMPVDAMRYKNNDIDNYSMQTFGEETKESKRRKNKAIDPLSTQSSGAQITERNERKTSCPDDKHTHKIWNNVAQRTRNETDEERSEGEINNIKGMESFVSFLKKKKGKYLTPPFTMLMNRELEKEREPKYGSDSINEVKKENKLPQKNRTDLVRPENVPVKSKKNVRPSHISPKMTEQSVIQKPVKKKPVEDKYDESASSGKFDLFKQLNREICKKNVKKSASVTSTINADFENKKTFPKPRHLADDDASFSKVKGFPTKFEERESSTKSKNFLPDFQEDNGTWSD